MYRAITKKESEALYKLACKNDALIDSYDDKYDELIFKPLATAEANRLTKELQQLLNEKEK